MKTTKTKNAWFDDVLEFETEGENLTVRELTGFLMRECRAGRGDRKVFVSVRNQDGTKPAYIWGASSEPEFLELAAY